MTRALAFAALVLVAVTIVAALVRHRPPPSRVPDLLRDGEDGEPARCDVGGDSRASRVLTAGQERTIAVRVPAASTLRYSLAASDQSPAPAWHLAIEAADGSGRILTEDRTTPTHAWVDRTVDLTAWSGREVIFRIATGPPPWPLSSHVCWAMPRVVATSATPRLVVVVLLDTVRADHLSLDGYGRATSPALETLAADSVTFVDFATDASWTRASVATLFTGQSSLVHGVLARDAHLGRQWPTMAERFRAAGTHTVAFSTNPNVLPFWGLARGFERFVDVGAAEWTANSDAARVLEAARAALNGAADESTLLYIHINDAHAPYDPPAAAAAAVLGAWDPSLPGRTLAPTSTPAEVRGAIDRYDGEIAHLDRELGRFFASLVEHRLYDSSLIVVVGDHGEEFMDHGGVYHGHTLFREQLHTPLVMKLPARRAAGTRRRDAATMRDVLPTVLAISGIEDALPGRVLLDRTGRASSSSSLPRFAATDMDDATVYAAEDAERTLIVQIRPTARRLLFDRHTDPRQQHDLSDRPSPEMLGLQASLDAQLLAQRAGWHARMCGAPTPMRTRIRIDSATPFTHIQPLNLESVDVLRGAEGARSVGLDADLAPQIRQEELFGRLVARTFVDEDEVILETDGPLSVTIEGAPVPVRVGLDARPLAAPDPPITREAAAAPATYTPRCGGDPALFVWHAGATAAAAVMDEDVARRLRALGYLR